MQTIGVIVGVGVTGAERAGCTEKACSNGWQWQGGQRNADRSCPGEYANVTIGQVEEGIVTKKTAKGKETLSQQLTVLAQNKHANGGILGSHNAQDLDNLREETEPSPVETISDHLRRLMLQMPTKADLQRKTEKV